MSFDRIAPAYRCLETLSFGNALQRARTFWLDRLPPPRRVLICGEGNGRFICELLRVHPKAEVECVDASPRMINLARQRMIRLCPQSLGQVHFVTQDILKWTPSAQYDLVVTHFFLDCFVREELKLITAKLAEAAGPGTIWLLADFTIPLGGKMARFHARAWLRVMYLFFRCTTRIAANEIIDPTPFLNRHGFVRVAQKVSRAGMLKSDLFAWHRHPADGPTAFVGGATK